MKKRVSTVCLGAFLAAAAASSWAGSEGSLGSSVQLTTAPSARHTFSYFEENRGQFDPTVLFALRSPSSSVFLTREGIVLSAASEGEKDVTVPVRLRFLHMRRTLAIEALDPQPGRLNYFRGTSRITGVIPYGSVAFRGIYDGIDLIFHATSTGVEYDFLVRPGGSAEQIRMHVDGSERIALTHSGDLTFTHRGHLITVQHRPRIYQTANGRNEEVSGRYVVRRNDIRFEIGRHDDTKTLVIDPLLNFSTHIGGATGYDLEGEASTSVYVDRAGGVYITGHTYGSNFPTAGTPYQPSPAYCCFDTDAFILKYDRSGTMVYGTFLGATARDSGFAITADESGHIYVAGRTDNVLSSHPLPAFPVTGYKTPSVTAGSHSANYVFVVELSADGSSLIFSSLIGGTYPQEPRAIALDAHHNIWVAGRAVSLSGHGWTPFPTTAGAYQTAGINRLGTDSGGTYATYHAFVVELNPPGTALIASTLLGGSWDETVTGMALDSYGDVWLSGYTTSMDFPLTGTAWSTVWTGERTIRAGFDETRTPTGFLAELSPNLRTLFYSTFLSHTESETPNGSTHYRGGVAIDAEDNIYVAGAFADSQFATTDGVYKKTGGGGFLMKFNVNAVIQFATFTPNSVPAAIAVNGSAVYIAGYTGDPNFTVVSPYQGTLAGQGDATLMRFNDTGSALEFSTFLGGSRQGQANGAEQATGMALDYAGNAYVVGWTDSTDFPITAGARSVGSGFYSQFLFDTDGDGLLDVWETNGIDVDGDGTVDLDLKALGANPNHKDLFLEVDYMAAANHTHDPRTQPNGTTLTTNPIQRVIDAFKNSGVANPDGQPGINLHVLVDEQLTEQTPVWFARRAAASFSAIKSGYPPDPCNAGHFGTPSDRSSSNCANILKAKRLAYRYCIFGHEFYEGPGQSGVAELSGNDFFVTLRVRDGRPLDFEQDAQRAATFFQTSLDAEWSDMVAGTFMHEFGHTLGLEHGGGLGLVDDDQRAFNYKPNYLSVMSYSRQLNKAAPDVNNTASILRINRAVDFSRSALPSLDESGLDERTGVTGPAGANVLFGQGGAPRVASATAAIDWNGQNGVESTPVSADINYLGPGTGAPTPNQLLIGHDDWSNLVYSFRGSKFFKSGDTSDLPVADEETSEDVSGPLIGRTGPNVTLTAPTNGQTFSAGATVSLAATASTTEGSIAKVEFLDGETVLGESTSSPYSYSWTTATTGTHLVTALATDDAGAAQRSPAATIGVGCTATFIPSSISVGAGGGSTSVTLTIPAACAWQANTTASWAILQGNFTGSGDATLALAIDPNLTSSSRSAMLNVAGQSVTITQDAAPAFGPPTNVIATATQRIDGSVYARVSWTGTGDVDHYEVAVSSGGGTYHVDGTTISTTYNASLAMNVAYLIKVLAVDTAGNASSYSAPDLATLVAFSDDPLQVGTTTVKAAHLTELRIAANAVRTLAGLSASSWTDASPLGLPIKAVHITELRAALNQAFQALSLPAISYAHPTLSVIRAIDIAELRSAVK